MFDKIPHRTLSNNRHGNKLHRGFPWWNDVLASKWEAVQIAEWKWLKADAKVKQDLNSLLI